jgi:hypothetical protein
MDRPLIVPPPWRLAGRGWVFLFTFERHFLHEGGFVPAGLPDGFEGNLGALVLVDYRESPVGPYRELLFSVGRNLRWRHHLLSVSRIYVSSAASAASGRANWGLPKEVAEFQTVQGRDGAERVIVLRGGLAEVDLTVAPEPRARAWPVSGFFIPPSWRTLVQPWEGKTLRTRLSGRGLVQRARLVDFRTVPQLFPDVTKGRLVAGYQVEGLRLGVHLGEKGGQT